MLNRGLSAKYIFVGIVVYLACISVVSHIPGHALVGLHYFGWDKLMHMAEYLPLGLLLAVGLRRPPLNLSWLVTFFIGLSLIFGFGMLDEFHQSFIPGRFSSWFDVLADIIGGAVGIVIAILSWSLNRSRYQTT